MQEGKHGRLHGSDVTESSNISSAICKLSIKVQSYFAFSRRTMNPDIDQNTPDHRRDDVNTWSSEEKETDAAAELIQDQRLKQAAMRPTTHT